MAFKKPTLLLKDEVVKVLVAEVNAFLGAEMGNKITAYNGSGLLNNLVDRLNRIEPVVLPDAACEAAGKLADEMNAAGEAPAA